MAKQDGALGFEKISAEGKVDKYTRQHTGTDDVGLKVAFKDVFFSDGHRDLLDRLMDDRIKVRVTIEVIDPTLLAKE